MPRYYRPLVQIDPVRPPGAEPLAGGWAWFTHAERLERGRAGRIVPAADIPQNWLDALTSRRAQVAALSMDRPRIMGILNTTPDSFSDGGRHMQTQAAVDHALAMAGHGADMIDIGGESTRPGAHEVHVDEEIARTVPVISAIAQQAPPLSIDTRKSTVANAAMQAGAVMINDVSAFGFDPKIADIAAKTRAFVCLMHSRGTPETMQDDPQYDDVLLDVFDALAERVAAALAAGVARDRIVVDPGIGFGKTEAHNLALLRGIAVFHGLGCPILLGASRKGFIGRIGAEPEPERRMPGSVAVALAGVAKGVQIVRVHDVRETRQAIALWFAATGLRQD